MADGIRGPFARGKPQLVRVQPQHIAADLAEAMDVAFPRGAPVDKLDPELERRLGGRDHLQRVDVGERKVIADVRDGRLADPDDPDLIRFYELDLDLAEPLREDRGSHPPGRAAA